MHTKMPRSSGKKHTKANTLELGDRESTQRRLAKAENRVYLQVHRVEEQHDIFALVVAQFDLVERAVDHCLTSKVRRWLADFRVASRTHLAFRTR